jgi:hypothetical protein
MRQPPRSETPCSVNADSVDSNTESIFGFESSRAHEYEEGFYLTSNITRLGKLITHYELYKMITSLPGDVIECGVFKAATFMQWLTFRTLLENPYSREIIGFDTFTRFPDATSEADAQARAEFVAYAGEYSISQEDLARSCALKGFINYTLVPGDICTTVPEYVAKNIQRRIALLHIDTDLYDPAKTILEHLYPQVVRGGVVVLDDYGTFPGGTQAVDEFLEKHDVCLSKMPLSHWIPSFFKKP